MALILNIDTATERGSVCVARDGIPLKTLVNTRQQDHAAMLTLFIQQILEELKTAPAALDAVAISGGPGSYTGLRVAAATAKGLCYAWELPLIAINTLEMMASGMFRLLKEEKCWYCPMIDARRQEVYTAVYDASLSVILPPAAVILEKNGFNELLQQRPICFFGNGSIKYQTILSSNPHAFFREYQPEASHLARLAEKAWEARRFEELAYYEPFYLKSFYIPSKD